MQHNYSKLYKEVLTEVKGEIIRAGNDAINAAQADLIAQKVTLKLDKLPLDISDASKLKSQLKGSLNRIIQEAILAVNQENQKRKLINIRALGGFDFSEGIGKTKEELIAQFDELWKQFEDSYAGRAGRLPKEVEKQLEATYILIRKFNLDHKDNKIDFGQFGVDFNEQDLHQELQAKLARVLALDPDLDQNDLEKQLTPQLNKIMNALNQFGEKGAKRFDKFIAATGDAAEQVRNHMALLRNEVLNGSKPVIVAMEEASNIIADGKDLRVSSVPETGKVAAALGQKWGINFVDGVKMHLGDFASDLDELIKSQQITVPDIWNEWDDLTTPDTAEIMDTLKVYFQLQERADAIDETYGRLKFINKSKHAFALDDVGLSEQELTDKLRQENEVLRENMDSWRERWTYLNNGRVVKSVLGSKTGVTSDYLRNFQADKVIHTHPLDLLSNNAFSPEDFTNGLMNDWDIGVRELELRHGDNKTLIQLATDSKQDLLDFIDEYLAVQGALYAKFGQLNKQGKFVVPDDQKSLIGDYLTAWTDRLGKAHGITVLSDRMLPQITDDIAQEIDTIRAAISEEIERVPEAKRDHAYPMVIQKIGLRLIADTNAQDQVAEAAKQLADEAFESTEQAQDSHSPSKVAEMLGEYWGIGYAEGIKKHKDDVANAVRELVRTGKITVEEVQEDMINIFSEDQYEPLANALMSMTFEPKESKEMLQNLNDTKAEIERFKESSVDREDFMDVRESAIEALAEVEKLKEANDALQNENSKLKDEDYSRFANRDEYIDIASRAYEAERAVEKLNEELGQTKERLAEAENAQQFMVARNELANTQDLLTAEQSKTAELQKQVQEQTKLAEETQKTLELEQQTTAELRNQIQSNAKTAGTFAEANNEQAQIQATASAVRKRTEAIVEETKAARTLHDVNVELLDEQKRIDNAIMASQKSSTENKYYDRYSEKRLKYSKVPTAESLRKKLEESFQEEGSKAHADADDDYLYAVWAKRAAIIDVYNNRADKATRINAKTLLEQFGASPEEINKYYVDIQRIRDAQQQIDKLASTNTTPRKQELESERAELLKTASAADKLGDAIDSGILALYKQPDDKSAIQQIAKTMVALQKYSPDATIQQFTQEKGIIEAVTAAIVKQKQSLDSLNASTPSGPKDSKSTKKSKVQQQAQEPIPVSGDEPIPDTPIDDKQTRQAFLVKGRQAAEAFARGFESKQDAIQTAIANTLSDINVPELNVKIAVGTRLIDEATPNPDVPEADKPSLEDETQQFGTLLSAVNNVTGAIDLKTRALQEEGQVSEAVIYQEINSFDALLGTITQVKDKIAELPQQIDVNIQEHVVSSSSDISGSVRDTKIGDLAQITLQELTNNVQIESGLLDQLGGVVNVWKQERKEKKDGRVYSSYRLQGDNGYAWVGANGNILQKNIRIGRDLENAKREDAWALETAKQQSLEYQAAQKRYTQEVAKAKIEGLRQEQDIIKQNLAYQQRIDKLSVEQDKRREKALEKQEKLQRDFEYADVKREDDWALKIANEQARQYETDQKQYAKAVAKSKAEGAKQEQDVMKRNLAYQQRIDKLSVEQDKRREKALEKQEKLQRDFEYEAIQRQKVSDKQREKALEKQAELKRQFEYEAIQKQEAADKQRLKHIEMERQFEYNALSKMQSLRSKVAAISRNPVEKYGDPAVVPDAKRLVETTVDQSDIESVREYSNELQKLLDRAQYQNGNLIKLRKNLIDINTALANPKSGMSDAMRIQATNLRTEMQRLIAGGQANPQQVADLNAQWMDLSASIVAAGKHVKTFGERLHSKNYQQLLYFFSQYTSIQSWVRYVREAFTAVKELDSALTELRVVSNASNSELQVISKSAYEIAQNVGSSATSIVQSITSWRRLGNSIADSELLAEQAARLSTGGIMDVSTATTALTSAMQAFDLGAQDVNKVVDQYIYLGNNYAITSEELATSLTKSVSALKTAGNTLEQIEALEIAGNTTLQDADVVSQALKVISMRLRGTSAKELEEAGESSDHLIENASKLYKTIKTLTKTQSNPDGVDIIDKQTNAYKSTYDILLEISKVWDEIDDANRAALLETMAGKTRGAAVASILDAGDVLEKAYIDAAQNSIGAGEKAIENSLDSIEKKILRAQEKLKYAARQMLDTTMTKGVLDDLDALCEALINAAKLVSPLVSGLGSLVGLLAKIGSSGFGLASLAGGASIAKILASFNSMRRGSSDILNYIQSGDTAHLQRLNTWTQRWALSQREALAATEGLNESMLQQTMTFGSFLKANSISLIFTASIAAITALVNQIKKAKQEIKDAANNLAEAGQEFKEHQKTIDGLIESYTKLSNKLKDASLTEEESREVKNDLLGVQQDLIGSYDDLAGKLDLVNGKYDDEIAKIREASKEEKNRWLNKNYADYDKYANPSSKSLPDPFDWIGFLDTDLVNQSSEVANILIRHGAQMKQYSSDELVTLDDLSEHIATRGEGFKYSLSIGSKDNPFEQYQEIQEIYDELIELRRKGSQDPYLEDALENAEKLLENDDNAIYAEDKSQWLKYYRQVNASVDDTYGTLYDNYTTAVSDAIKNLNNNLFDAGVDSYIKNMPDDSRLFKAPDIIKAAFTEAAQEYADAYNEYAERWNQRTARINTISDRFWGPGNKERAQGIISNIADRANLWNESDFDELEKRLQLYSYNLDNVYDSYFGEVQPPEEPTYSLSEWYRQNSEISSKDKTYVRNELIDAYKSAIEGLGQYIKDNENPEATIDVAEIIKVTSDPESIYNNLGMDGFESYFEASGQNVEMAISQYLADMQNKLIEGLGNFEDLDEAGKQAIQTSLQGMMNVALGGSNELLKLKAAYEELTRTYERALNGAVFTQEEIETLNRVYGLNWDAVKKVAGGYRIETDALRDLTNGYIDNYNTGVSLQNKLTRQTIEDTKKRIQALKDEIAAMAKTVQAVDDLKTHLFTNNGLASGGKRLPTFFGIAETSPEIRALEDYLQSLYDQLADESPLTHIGEDNQPPEYFDEYELRIQNIQDGIDDIDAKWENKDGVENQLKYLEKLDGKYEELKRTNLEAAKAWRDIFDNLDSTDEEKVIVRGAVASGLTVRQYDSNNKLDEKTLQRLEKMRDVWNNVVQYENAARDAQSQIEKNALAEAQANLELTEQQLAVYDAQLQDESLSSAQKDFIYKQQTIALEKKYQQEIALTNDELERQSLTIQYINDLNEIVHQRYQNRLEDIQRQNEVYDEQLNNPYLSDAQRESIINQSREGNFEEYNAQINMAEDLAEQTKLRLERDNQDREAQESILEIYQAQRDAIHENIAAREEEIEAAIDFVGGRGLASQYQALIDLNSRDIEQYLTDKADKELELAKKIQDEGLEENSDEYRKIQSELNEIESQIAACEKKTKDWAQAIIELPLRAIEDTLEELNKQLDANNEQISDWDDIIAGAQAYIDAEVKGYQDELDALQKTNQARERALALSKAQYDLDRAKNQKNVKIFREGKGFVYESNQSDLRNAQEAYDKAMFDKRVGELQDAIDELNKIKDLWAQISTNATNALNMDKFMSWAVGQGLSEDVALAGALNASLIEAYHIQESYTALTKNGNYLEKTIDAWEKFRDEIQKVSEQFQYGVITQSEAAFRVLQSVANFGEKVNFEPLFKQVFGSSDMTDWLKNLVGSDKVADVDTLKSALHDLATEAGIVDEQSIANFIDYFDKAGLLDAAAGIEQLGDSTAEAGLETETGGEEIAAGLEAASEGASKAAEEASAAGEGVVNESIEIDQTLDEMSENLGEYSSEVDDATLSMDTAVSELAGSLAESCVQIDQIMSSVSSGISGAFSGMSATVQSAMSGISANITTALSAARSALSELQRLAQEASTYEGEITTHVEIKKSTNTKYKPIAYDEINHSGIATGLVGAKDGGAANKDEKMKLLGLKPLESDEITSILRVGEAVLTKQQQQNVLHNITSAYKAGAIDSAKIQSLRTAGTAVVNVTFPGDMTFNQVQDIDSYFEDMAQKVKNVFIQQFAK